MKQFSKAMLALFLSVILLASCKKNQIEDATADGSKKNGGKTSATRNIYVSVSIGNDASTNPFSASTPYKTLQKAADITVPGDIVYIMNGTYEPPKQANGELTTDPNQVTLNITRSGSATGGYITYKRYPGHWPVLYTYGKKWGTIFIDASYITIDGLELKGANNNTPGGAFLDAAKAAAASYHAGGRDWTHFSQFNTSGVHVGKDFDVHHVNIYNCNVHDFPGGGIANSRCDYLTVQGNTSYNNVWFSMYGGSGISVLFPKNADSNTGYKIKILKNTCYNNFSQVAYFDGNGTNVSDGNGIIIDINYNSSKMPVDYNGKTLVENNLVHKNGGSGIHTFHAQNVDLFNNTSYDNEKVLPNGNLAAYSGKNIRFRNNIAFSKSGGRAFLISGGSNITSDYNLYYNGSAASDGTSTSTHNKNTNPSFVDRFNSNFLLQSTSPAINAGDPTTYPGMSSSDIRWTTRIKNGRVDMGAYEVN